MNHASVETWLSPACGRLDSIGMRRGARLAPHISTVDREHQRGQRMSETTAEPAKRPHSITHLLQRRKPLRDINKEAAEKRADPLYIYTDRKKEASQRSS